MSNLGTQYLFLNQTTDANSTAFAIPYSNKVAVIKVWGTFDGANVKFQTLAPGTSASPVWIDVPDDTGNIITFVLDAQRALKYLIQNEQLRAVLSNAGASTSITASVEMY